MAYQAEEHPRRKKIWTKECRPSESTYIAPWPVIFKKIASKKWQEISRLG